MDPEKSATENPNVTVWGVHLMDASALTRKEREELLLKLNRIFTFVGTEVPEEIELDGEVVALHEVMWHLINHKNEVTAQECAAVQRLWGLSREKYGKSNRQLGVRTSMSAKRLCCTRKRKV